MVHDRAINIATITWQGRLGGRASAKHKGEVSAGRQSRLRASRRGQGMPSANASSRRHVLVSLPHSLPPNPFLPGRLPRCVAAACHQGHRSENSEHCVPVLAPLCGDSANDDAEPPGVGAGTGPKQPQSRALWSKSLSGKRGRENAQGAETAALGPTAKVCLVRTSAVGALCSAYPQPTLSLPSNPFPSRSR